MDSILSDPSPSSAEQPSHQIAGFWVILNHILVLIGILSGVLLVLTSITLISRITRKNTKQSNKLSIRTRIEVYLTATGIIHWIEGVQTVLSVFSVVTYIYGTYLPINKKPPLFYPWIELSLTIFFTLHWMLDYYMSKDRLRYLYSFFSIVDLVTVLPIYIDLAYNGIFTELSTFQFLRVIRSVRVLRANRVLHIFNDITQYLFRVVIAIFTFILIVAAFYMNVDVHPTSGQPLQFHETIYFLVVTLTTDGYGDIHPTNAVGQLTITFAICIGAVLIPYQVSRLLDKFSSYSPYKRDLSNENLHGHILLCGEINFTSLLEFLTEFYLEKYGQLKKTIVILNSNPPSDQLKTLLLHPFYKNRLYYLEGSPMLESDLKRARFSHTSSCFVFRPLFWEEGDANAILTALAMKNLKSRGSKIFTQLVHHESKYKISSNIKHVMCIEDFRNDDKWVVEYVNGSVNSIYKIPVPVALIGETLGYVTTTMYTGAKALILGIIYEEGTSGTSTPPLSISGAIQEILTSPRGAEMPHTSKKGSRFVIHPPFSTVLTSSMQLVIIAHSPTAPVFKPNIPSIIRSLDKEERESSFLTNVYNRLFAPEEIRRFTELQESGVDNILSSSISSFFTSTYTSAIEMDTLSPRSDQGEMESGAILSDINNNNSNVATSPTNNNSMPSSSMLSAEQETPLAELCRTEFNGNWEEFLCTVVESVDSKKAHLQEIVEELEPIIRSVEKHQNLDNDDLLEEEEEENNWHEHIIICGSVNRIDLFLRGLRQKHIADNINHFYFIKNHLVDNTSSPPPIVILHPEEPDMSEWDDIEDIFFVKGSPLERNDLEKVKIHTAAKIIVLSDPYTPHHISSLTDKTSVQLDSETIMAYLEINEMLRDKDATSFITVELVHEPNIRFISKNLKSLHKSQSRLKRETDKIEKPKYYVTSEFASGKVLTLTTLDSLICQANHQEFLLDVATELVLGVNGIKKYHQKFSYNNTSDTSSEDEHYGVLSDSESESEYQRKQQIKQQHQQYLRSSQRNLPEQFHGRTYGELFEGLVLKNILSLGLYRCKEITGAPNPY
eukprot:gene5621-6484_t